MTDQEARQFQDLRAALERSELRQQELSCQLQVQKARLDAAQSVAIMGSWETDLETLETSWSLQTHHIFATDPETFKPSHRSFLEFVHPQDRQAVDQAFQLSQSKATPCAIEHRVLLANGQLKTVEERWQTFFDKDGKAIRAVGTCQEISQRKADQEALLRNERLLRIAGHFARMGGWELNLETGLVSWSEETFLIHELPPGTTPSLEEALDYYAPEYREHVAREVQASISLGQGLDFEAELITATGKRVWVRAVGEAVRDAQGRVISLQGAFQDLSERKRWEQEATRVAERLSTTLESLTDAFFTLDLEWRFTFLNCEAEKLLRLSRQQALGLTMWELFPQALGTNFERGYRRSMAEKVPIIMEEYYAPFELWVEVHAYPSPEGMAVYIQDVSERRQHRESLRTSEERFRLLSKATNDAIWDWDLQSQSLWWSDGFETLFGFDRNAVESTIDSWFNRIHPEELERVKNEVQGALDSGLESWAGEYRFARHDGTYAPVLNRGYIIRDEAGVSVRIVGGMTDLSERKQAEARIAEQAALIDHASDAIIVTDLDQQIRFWSKGAERIFGWTTQQAIGQARLQLLQAEAEFYARADRQVREKGEWSGEFQKRTRDGTVLTVDARWTLLRDEHGQPSSILSIESDISQRKLLEQQFLRAQRLESIGTLAGGIAHDLNNMLTPITMSVEMLKAEAIDPFSTELLEVIGISAQRGADMVRQVLSFARGMEGRRMEVQPRHLLRETEQFTRETFSKSIDIQVKLPDDLWTVSGDPTQLHQVLVNLCVNARDALENGGTLKLSAGNLYLDEHYAGLDPEASPGPYVVIEVEDSGTGIPAEILVKIFDPFFTTKEPGKGSGLGLSTTVAIIKSHGGFLRVLSQPGQGTTFKVFLPASSEASLQPPEVRESPSLLPRGKGELILVVDDEAAVRHVTGRTLETFGYRVLLAADGAEALSVYAEHAGQISAVITDLMMPVFDGASTIEVLRRLEPKLPVIAASGLTSPEQEERLARLGVAHFLPKPYTAEPLVRALRSILPATPEERNEGMP